MSDDSFHPTSHIVATASATHPEWVALTDDSHPLGAGHPVLDDDGKPVARDGFTAPEEAAK